MCKIFAMTSLVKVKVTQDLIGIVRDAVCKKSDKDGFGYAVSTIDGQLWGERSLNPMAFEAFKPSDNVTRSLEITHVSPRDSFGPVQYEDNNSFIAHGRFSTNDVSLANTHPFTNDNVALIHNGVVSDPYNQVKNLSTSCDTEILLKLWEDNGIEAIEDNAAGYYAIALLDKLGQLHIARDSMASLFIAYSRTVDSFLIATTEEILTDIASRMHWTLEPIEPILDNLYVVFNGNDIVTKTELNPLGYVKGIDDDKVSAALGYDDTYDYNRGMYLDEIDDIDGPLYRTNSDDMPIAYADELPSRKKIS